MTSLVIALQADAGSSRLPGNVLEYLGRHTLLAHCIRRLQTADLGPVIVATTTDPVDDAVEREARRCGALVQRGPTHDRLARCVAVVDEFGGRYLVCATADNPAVDIDAPGRLLKAVLQSRAEYGIETGLPFGAAVDVIAADTLRYVDRLAVGAGDREDVTRYLQEHMSEFRSIARPAPLDVRRPDLRFTVDTPADLSFMRGVLEKVDDGPHPAPLTAIIASADAVVHRARAA
jgi:spore coat polysaccharide biosynthesis protein SpsF (cytidylyltransferase family)